MRSPRRATRAACTMMFGGFWKTRVGRATGSEYRPDPTTAVRPARRRGRGLAVRIRYIITLRHPGLHRPAIVTPPASYQEHGPSLEPSMRIDLIAACLALLLIAARPGAGRALPDRHRRRRELLRRRRRADRRAGRARHQHPQQPGPGPASVRGEPVGRARPLRRADRHLQRHRLRPVDGEAARRRAVGRPHGHRRRRPGGPQDRRQPAYLVRPGHHAGLRQGLGRRAGRHRSGAQGGLRAAPGAVRGVDRADPGQDRRAAPAPGRHAGHRDRAGVRLYVRRPGDAGPQPVASRWR